MRLKELITDHNNKLSSKRFLAIFVFSPVLIIAIFLHIEPNVIYALTGLITTLLLGSSAEKFAKNQQNNDEVG